MNKKRLFSKQCYLAKGTRVWLGLKVMKAERKICWDEQKPKRKQQQIQAGLCWDCCFFPEAATLGFMTKTKTLLQTWSEALHLVQVSLKKKGFQPSLSPHILRCLSSFQSPSKHLLRPICPRQLPGNPPGPSFAPKWVSLQTHWLSLSLLQNQNLQEFNLWQRFARLSKQKACCGGLGWVFSLPSKKISRHAFKIF